MPGFGKFDLTGRVALVTGGSRGLGKSMARLFAEAGADIAICSRNAKELETALPEILAGTGRRGEAIVADLSQRGEADVLVAEVLKRLGKIDILINNAGTNKPQAIDQIDDASWDQLLELNLTSCMTLSRAVVPQMKERRWGRIVHISSVMGIGSKEGRNAYSTTKAALLGLARASALDLGSFGITVNCIAPGPFLTDLPGSMLTDAEKKTFAERTALGRWGDPTEIAGPALLLASDAGSYITGTCLVVDGGCLIKTF